MIPELFRTNGTCKLAFNDSIGPIFAVLRYVRSNGDLVPVKTDPFVKFWHFDEIFAFIIDAGAVLKAVDVIESTWNLDFNFSGAFRAGSTGNSSVATRGATGA